MDIIDYLEANLVWSVQIFEGTHVRWENKTNIHGLCGLRGNGRWKTLWILFEICMIAWLNKTNFNKESTRNYSLDYELDKIV